MAGHTLPAEHLVAGREFRVALRGLGLDPEGLLWAFDKTIGTHVLVLVTSHLDHAGPLALYRLLTRAYNASVTPALIDPFIVRTHSPKQWISAELRKAYGWDIRVGPFIPADPSQAHLEVVPHFEFTMDAGDLTFAKEWVYQFREQKVAPAERQRRWRRFEKNVEALPVAA